MHQWSRRGFALAQDGIRAAPSRHFRPLGLWPPGVTCGALWVRMGMIVFVGR